jgi:hypothetical protein
MFSDSKIKAIRHIMSPSASISFTPDVSSFMPNYYRTLYLPDNKKIDYSIFDGRFGGTPNPNRGKYSSIALALNNTLDMKYTSTTDTSSEVKKITLLQSFNFSTNYNVFAPGDTCNFSNINMLAATSLFNNKLNLTYNSTFDPYTLSNLPGATSHLRYFELQKNKGLARLTSASFSLGTSFESSAGKKSTTNADQQQNPNLPNNTINPNNQFAQPQVNYDIPWSVRVDYSWDYSKPGSVSSLSQTSRFSGTLGVTKKWQVGVSSGYDITNKSFSLTTFNISRDLHCWEMHFTWVPFGPRTSYSFTINVKAALLKDLKYTMQSTWQDRLQ